MRKIFNLYFYYKNGKMRKFTKIDYLIYENGIITFHSAKSLFATFTFDLKCIKSIEFR